MVRSVLAMSDRCEQSGMTGFAAAGLCVKGVNVSPV